MATRFEKRFETRKENENTHPAPANRPQASDVPKTVPLPAIPESGSPVPWLTSIHGTPGRGNYGDAGYRGNCSGLLIKDLLQFYRPRRVLDPMEGSGTCRDVCRELRIEYFGGDIRLGFDATDPKSFERHRQLRLHLAPSALLEDGRLQPRRASLPVECRDAPGVSLATRPGPQELPLGAQRRAESLGCKSAT